MQRLLASVFALQRTAAQMTVRKSKLASVCLAMLALSVLTAGCASESNDVGSDESMAPLKLTLETDKARYRPDGIIVMWLTITNESNRPLVITFASAQRYDFVIGKGREEIWRWSRGRMFAMAISEARLNASQSVVYEEQWSQKDNEGNPVPTGQYQVSAVLKSEPERSASPVTIEILTR